MFGFAPHNDIDRQHLRFGAPEDVNCGAKLLAQTVVSYADSPDGPWTPANKVIIPNGAEGEWDQNTVHDPYPLVHNGKIYLYYKADFGRFRDQPRKKSSTHARFSHCRQPTRPLHQTSIESTD
ncbi:hypothetical protein RS130_18035 [Paraglaciecola aquimarina]|uniref:Uncharacterized protein n=1 Tax=Paraglaciecola aquimarina TaxID=1235557 RepID=A0ABU3SZV4_9ALTE|nr:hypothetical protein [Paraglaciecola aquimarina]MDU0355539.1 hypothetical protein [Paraglaciecola aquimarina]